MWKDKPSTARTTPFGVQNGPKVVTCKSDQALTLKISGQLKIERIAQPVAQQVHSSTVMDRNTAGSTMKGFTCHGATSAMILPQLGRSVACPRR